MVMMLAACGASSAGASVPTSEETNAATSTSQPVEDSVDGTDAPEDDALEDDALEDEADASTSSGEGVGSGVILADLCSGGQPLDGAISTDDLVEYGMFTSTDVVIEGGVRDATGYATFGFLCNLSEEVGDGENFLTIGVNPGSDIWDLAFEQSADSVEQMGDWEVIISSNWLSPLTMHFTDDAGNQDSLFALWTPADGSIPDGATLEAMMRPFAEAIAARSSVDIPRT